MLQKILESGRNLDFPSMETLLKVDKMRLFGQLVLIYYSAGIIYSFGKDAFIYGFSETIYQLYKKALSTSFKAFQTVPGTKSLIDSEVNKIVKSFEEKMIDSASKNGIEDTLELPSIGFDPEKTIDILEKRMNEGHIDWKSGRVSGTVYFGGLEHINLMNKAIGIYNITNPLHPDVFPGLRRLDAEVVSMVLRMFNSPEDGCGTTTSGGTESIIMAVRAHLEKAKKERNVTNPNLVAPVTIHTAFDKACGYFNIELIRIPIDNKSGKVDIHILEKAINKNTIMIAGSAINYPHGVMDDIETMASIAMKKGIGMHVDCCLGSFLMPFMEDAGFKIPNFDFRVPGVTSISCDTHKYGFAPKGSSVIMYSNRKLRHYQYFVCTEWPGGIYASPTIAGSSSLPGSLIAGCWAALVSIGKEGYITSCRNIVNSRIKIQQG
ncbi:Sphingosine-1-phosphate lyase, partial [Smittium culicis]